MGSFISVHASGAPPPELNAVLNDYMALERIRICRRLLAVRVGVPAAAAALAALVYQWPSTEVAAVIVAACLAPLAYAWALERKRAGIVARRVEELHPSAGNPVVKKS